MVSSKNNKKGAESGGQLLQELEALSQALYKGGSNASEHGRTRRDRRISEAGNVSNTTKIDEPIRGRHARHSISGIDPKKDLETREDEFPEWLEDNINFSKKLGAPAEKKNSLWNWKPFRALAHIGQQRNLCEFSAHVRAIDNLPASTNGLRLQVHLKHHEVATHTSPARVHLGSVEFDDVLYVKCSVYGSKKSTGEIKYMAKSFTISVTAPDVDGLELGKHKIDLSRLLPEITDDKATPDQWSTSFSLSGKAKGGSLMVTFGYEFVDKDSRRAGNSSLRFVPQNPFSETRNFNSMPNSPHMKLKSSKSSMYSPAMSEPATDLLDYPIEHLSLEDEVVSIKSDPAKLNSKFNVFDQLDYSSLDTRNSSRLEKPLDSIHATGKEQQQKGTEVLFEEEEDDEGGSEFVVVDQGVELGLLSEDNTHLQHQGKDVVKEIVVDTVAQEMKVYTGTLQDVDNSEGMKEDESLSGQLEEMERTLNNLDQDIESMLKKGLDDESREIGIMPLANEQSSNSVINVDDEADQVAGEFLHMLEEGKETTSIPGSDSEPESPRALLLKQFEREALLEGGLGLNISISEGRETAIGNQAMLDEPEISGGGTSSTGHYFDDPDDFELSEIMNAAETELQKAKQMMWSKARAKMLEDAETEALMQEWGLNEKVFQNVSPKSSSRLPGSFSDVMDITKPPPLAYGLGAVIHTNDGGLLRSMDPIHFVQSRNSSNLVMHVSKPIVVPVDMGSSALDILRKLAATGMDDLALQATYAMPMEDITGKSINQIALEGQHVAHGQRYLTATETAGGVNFNSITDGTLLNHHSSVLKTSSGSVTEVMAKHATSGNKGEEFLSLDELAPMAMQQIEALAMEGLKIQAEMAEEDAPYTVDALPWSDVSRLEGGKGENVIGSEADGQDDDSSLMSMGISLDEWMRLDAGVYDGHENNEKTLAILNVHNAAHKDIIVSKNKGEGSNTDQGGLMGDTLTLAMLVQLRDPLRNYEPVGAPMMALVQAERVMVPPRPKIWKTISFKGNNEDKEEIKQDDKGPQFKIVGVHMSGFKVNEESKDNKNKIWANQKQQQSGSRWLMANGMSKTPKHSILKTKPGLQSTAAANKAESLWSISGRSPGAVTNRSYSRNPDVSFSKSSFRKQK